MAGFAVVGSVRSSRQILLDYVRFGHQWIPAARTHQFPVNLRPESPLSRHQFRSRFHVIPPSPSLGNLTITPSWSSRRRPWGNTWSTQYDRVHRLGSVPYDPNRSRLRPVQLWRDREMTYAFGELGCRSRLIGSRSPELTPPLLERLARPSRGSCRSLTRRNKYDIFRLKVCRAKTKVEMAFTEAAAATSLHTVYTSRIMNSTVNSL